MDQLQRRMAAARDRAEVIVEQRFPRGARVTATRVYAGEPYCEVRTESGLTRTVWPERLS